MSEGRRPRIVADLVRGLEAHALVSPESARLFAPVLREYLNRKVRAEGWRLPEQIWADLEALEDVAAFHRRQERETGDVVATTVQPWSPGTVEGDDDAREVTVTKAAEILGIDRRVVARRCDRGSLPYRQDERGVRLIRVENLGMADAS